MKTLANLNGEIMPLAEVKISALDRGFLFGDAVYEVLRVYQGRPWLQREHFGRLQRSLEAIRMPGIDLQELRKRVLETARVNGLAGRAGAFLEAVTNRGKGKRQSEPSIPR